MNTKIVKTTLLFIAILINLDIAFKILSLKSNWAVVGFVLYIILLIFLTSKTIKKL